MANYLADHHIDPNGAQGKTLMALASVAIGGAAGGANGASTALQGEQYNRQLHPSEQQLAQTLAAHSDGRYTTQQIEDALRLSGYSLGAESVMPGETSQTGSVVDVKDAGSIYDTQANWLLAPGPNGSQYLIQQVPSQVSPDLAAYIIANTGGASSPYAWGPDQEGMSDGAMAAQKLEDWASSTQVGTRALGGLQMVGGGLEVAGGMLTATTCETGLGCAGAMYLTGAGLDNAKAGSDTLMNGQPTATLGEQALQGVGLSPYAASLVYGATQVVPAGVEGYAVNVAADAQAAANAVARGSYVGGANGIVPSAGAMGTPQYTFNAVENPGPLASMPGTPAANFYSGQYNMSVSDDVTTLYRAGSSAPGSELGQWYTTEPPQSMAQVRIDSAVQPQWIDPVTGVLTGESPIDTVYGIQFPAGTTMYNGPVGYQGGVYLGGSDKNQIFIFQPWNIPGVQVISRTPLH
jgi:filamentous hemagglutinin